MNHKTLPAHILLLATLLLAPLAAARETSDATAAPAPATAAVTTGADAASAPDNGAAAPTENRKLNTENSGGGAAAPGTIEGRIYSKLQGRTLLNARVTVKGTIIQAFSDQYGDYRLVDVPPGNVELEVFYTGMTPVNQTVTLAPGARVTQDFELILYGLETTTTETGTAAAKDDIVQLEKFSVNARRETSMSAIAVNEQRFSTVNKSVIDVEAFGEQTTDNVGDFLKFMPGVAVNYDGADPVSVSVRGMGPAFVPVTADGVPVASATPDTNDQSSRAFSFDQVDINNISRIEATKMPKPSDPANMIGGAVNLISRSAFESKIAKFRYSILYNLNSEDIELLRKTPGPLYNETYKGLPGFMFSWTYPITPNFGIVLTGRINRATREYHQSQTLWNFMDSTNQPLWSDPFMEQYSIMSQPSIIDTQSTQLRADWRIARNHTFSFTYGLNYKTTDKAKRAMIWDTGGVPMNKNNGGGIYANQEYGYTPQYGYYSESPEAPAKADTEHPGNYIAQSQDFSVSQNVGGSSGNTVQNLLNLKYNYRGRLWNIDAGLSGSFSRYWRRDGADGYFSSVTTKIKNYVGRIGFYGIDPYGDNAPSSIKIYNVRTPDDLASGFQYGLELGDPNTGTKDAYDASNYRVDKVQLSTFDNRSSFSTASFNVEHVFGNLPFGAAVKMGTLFSEQMLATERGANRMTMLNDTTSDLDPMMRYKEASAYIDYSYSNVSPGFGLPNIQWVSPEKVYQAWLQHPDWFAPVKSQAQQTARDIYEGDTKITENIAAFFFQFDGRFLDNRLTVTTGVRWEMTDDRGLGCYEPTIGDSAEDIYANWIRRGARSHRTYNDLYPSLHLNYNITANLKVRLSWATAMARPDFKSILPSLQINESDTVYESEIDVHNPNLKPYKAQSYDLTIEYYTHGGGYVGASAFYKRISGFFADKYTVATLDVLNELGLSTDYLGYVISSQFNLDSMTTVYGGEAYFSMPLSFMGGWGRSFTLWGNVSLMNINADYRAELGMFIRNMGNLSLQYRIRRLSLGLNANYRGRQKQNAQMGSNSGNVLLYQPAPESAYDMVPFRGFYSYQAPWLTIDANMEYIFSNRLSFIATVRNITNRPQKFEIYNPTSAADAPWSKSYQVLRTGATITMGIKGTF